MGEWGGEPSQNVSGSSILPTPGRKKPFSLFLSSEFFSGHLEITPEYQKKNI
jgi:hypothetical protein